MQKDKKVSEIKPQHLSCDLSQIVKSMSLVSGDDLLDVDATCARIYVCEYMALPEVLPTRRTG